MIIFFGNRILGRKPQILLCINGILKACFGKTLNGLFRVMDSLNDSGALKLMNDFSCHTSVYRRKDKLGFSGSGNLNFRVFIDNRVSRSGTVEKEYDQKDFDFAVSADGSDSL